MFVYFVNALLQNTMAEQNVPAQPPTRTDEQIVPRSQWLTIGKSNLLFNAQKIQKNPIFQISVDILSNTNSFQAIPLPHANVHISTCNILEDNVDNNEKTGVSHELWECNSRSPDNKKHFRQSSYYPKYMKMVAANTKKTPQESASMQPATKRATPKKPTTTTPVKQTNRSPSVKETFKRSFHRNKMMILNHELAKKLILETPQEKEKEEEVSSSKAVSYWSSSTKQHEATNNHHISPEITPFIALQLRVARSEQEMYEVLERHTANLIEKYSVLPGPESIQNQESEKSPKEIIKAKKEQEDVETRVHLLHQVSTDKVDLEEFDLKSALFSHMNKKKSANKNTTNYRLYHALMEALIADEDAMDYEPKFGQRNQGFCEALASKQHPTLHPALTSTGWQITDTRDAGADSSMHRSDPESEHSEQSSDDISKQDEGNDSDMEDTDNAHIPKVSTTTWFKPIPESERPATPEPEWTIPPNDFPEPEHNWANAYATTFKVPEENKLQRKTYDIGSFIKWFCRRTGKKKLCKADLEGPAFNLVKAFHKNSVFLQYQMDECHKLLTNKVDLSNPEGHQILRNIYEPLPLGGPPGQVTIQPQFFFNKDLEYLLTGDKERKIALSISKLKAARYLDFGLEELVPSLWVESEREYDISAVYGITHWWFRRKEFYINKHSESSDREAVRSQMRILSVISVKVFEKYGYNYLREIILRRADYQEYKISERDFKNLHPNDFEDLFLLNIQEKLNHLPKTDKISLHTAVNMWIRNLVIRNRVGDLQLGIESYQTKINLEHPNWDAADYYFKEDYTIVPKPRAVVYRDRNDQRKLMRLNELHKFSDGTLTRVMEKLDQMVKDFHLFEYNKGMETRKWSEDDKRRSKDFITAIEKRLQIRRIYRSLESFVGGRIRDVDYRLINRTT
ncbi:hypothetical protein Tco_0257191 [Tanacetum coccineum]